MKADGLKKTAPKGLLPQCEITAKPLLLPRLCLLFCKMGTTTAPTMLDCEDPVRKAGSARRQGAQQARSSPRGHLAGAAAARRAATALCVFLRADPLPGWPGCLCSLPSPCASLPVGSTVTHGGRQMYSAVGQRVNVLGLASLVPLGETTPLCHWAQKQARPR